jgi:DNA-3-methyladenine glycosylase I
METHSRVKRMTANAEKNNDLPCSWYGNDAVYQDYHDNVWGRPRRESQDLFAKLCLDGQQAGLSWITILKKEQTYYQAYDDFDPTKIARYEQDKIDSLLLNPGIIRNKLKVQSIIKNAKGYLEIEKERPFSDFIWSFVEGKAVQNRWMNKADIPVLTPASEAMSKALKRRGFTFVGPTICYAFMQAVGMVNDHLSACPQHKRCEQVQMVSQSTIR